MPPGAIIPVLVYDDVAAAVAWLCEAFGFKERLRIGDHRAQLTLGEESVVVAARPARAAGAPEPLPGEVTHSIMVRVADVDAHYERVRQHGGRVLGPPETYPFGERQYTVEDPGGHHWTFSQAVADVAPEAWGGQLR